MDVLVKEEQPGKPQMKVVRSTRPEMRSRSFLSKVIVCSRVGRAMPKSTMLLMCCSGMSKYLHTCEMTYGLCGPGLDLRVNKCELQKGLRGRRCAGQCLKSTTQSRRITVCH